MRLQVIPRFKPVHPPHFREPFPILELQSSPSRSTTPTYLATPLAVQIAACIVVPVLWIPPTILPPPKPRPLRRVTPQLRLYPRTAPPIQFPSSPSPLNPFAIVSASSIYTMVATWWENARTTPIFITIHQYDCLAPWWENARTTPL